MIDFTKSRAAVDAAFVMFVVWKAIVLWMLWSASRRGFAFQAADSLVLGVDVAVAYVVRTLLHGGLTLLEQKLPPPPPR